MHKIRAESIAPLFTADSKRVKVADLSSVPQLFFSSTQEYWLQLREDKVVCLTNICPHRGFPVQFKGTEFTCMGHGWRFDANGINVHNTNPGLLHKETIEVDGFLNVYEMIPEDDELQKAKEEIVLELVSHACVNLKVKNSKILFDPWYKGLAFEGSWFLYPPPLKVPEDIDAIVITHEHSDHFNTETLNSLNKSIPVYFPAFVSMRLEHRLRKMGFTKIFPCNFGVRTSLNEDISIEFLRPSSLWEDSGVFVVAPHFNWLNLNDAGYTPDIGKLPRDITLLSTSFDQGATDYPYMWDVSVNRKKLISNRGRLSTLDQISRLCELVNAQNYMPIASYWRHAQNEHQEAANYISHTNHQEIKENIQTNTKNTKFIDIYPGENWNYFTGNVEKRFDREKLFTESHIEETRQKYLNEFCQKADLPKSNSRRSLNRYFNRMRRVAELVNCESVIFEIELVDENINYRFVHINHQSNEEPIKITLVTSYSSLGSIIGDNLSWDELRIGWWGRWSRRPDVPTMNFFRLLQIGLTSHWDNVRGNEKDNHENVSESENLRDKSVATLLHRDFEKVSRVFHRYGLPCASCQLSHLESLQNAFEVHKIPSFDQDLIQREINWISIKQD